MAKTAYKGNMTPVTMAWISLACIATQPSKPKGDKLGFLFFKKKSFHYKNVS